MSEIIKKSDISEKDIYGYVIASAKNAEIQVNALNNELRESAKLNADNIKKNSKLSNTAEIKATENAIKLSNIQLKEKLKLENDLIKIQAQKINAERLYTEAETKSANAKEKSNRATEKAIINEEKLKSVYQKVQTKLNGLANEYRNISIKKELGAKLTEKEAQRYDFLQAKLLVYDGALKRTDATMGKHQRQVGNYNMAYNGLGNSVNQLTREMPAFANSIGTGFMAISNNLPIFFDEISKIKQANVDLVAQGKPTESIFKQIGKSIFSVGSLLSVGVTLLTVYGAKMVEFFTRETKAEKAVKLRAEAMKEANKQSREAQKNMYQETSAFVGNLLALRNTNKGSKERIDMINKINAQYGTTLKNISDETKFQEQLNKSIQNYILWKKAEFKVKKNEDLIARNLNKQDELNVKLKNELLNESIALSRVNIFMKSGVDDVNKARVEEQFGLTQSREKIKEYKNELFLAGYRLNQYGFNLFDANTQIEQYGLKTDKSTKSTKDFKTELSDLNLDLKNERDILNDINKILEENNIKKQSALVNDEFVRQEVQVTTTGDLFTDELELLLNEQYDLEKIARLKQLEFAKETLDIELNNQFDEKKKALEKERIELLSQENISQSAKDKINENYKVKLNELNDFQIEQIRITEIQKKQLFLETEKDLEAIDERRFEEIESMNNELIDLQIEFFDKSNEKTKEQIELEKKKQLERFQTMKEFVDLSLDYFIKQSEKKIAQIDKEISASEKQSEILEQLAINGNITAQQSLVVQQQITQKANNEKIKEQKRIENLKALEQAYDIYSTNLEKTGDPKQALVQTVTDIQSLKLLLSILPSYKDGIEDTGPQGKGVDGIGGFHAILHPNERVVNEENNQKMKGISNDELGNLAQSYKMGKVINLKKQDHAGNTYDLALLNEMKGVRNAIKNIPTSDVRLGEIYQGFMQIIETRKTGNKTTRDTFNIRK